MNILRNAYLTLYHTFLDALFPISTDEKALILLTTEEALRVLPCAPEYDASVVPLPNTRSIFAYKDSRVSRLVWNIKYKKERHSLEIAGFALKEALEQDLEGGFSENNRPITLLPIPTTALRERERGYNQCELLIDEIMRLDISRKFKTYNNLLLRVADSARNKTKGRTERLEGSKGIFAVNEGAFEEAIAKFPEFKKQPIIVIDDVITTGSTMKEVQNILRAAGFTDVRGLSLAH